MKTLLALLLGLAVALGPSPAWTCPQAGEARKEEKKDKKQKKEKQKKKDQSGGDEPRAEPGDAARELTRLLRELQMALEGSSPRSFLQYFDSAKFDDYPRFEDMVERLLREDTIRAYFRTAFNTPPSREGRAQMLVDAEMEVGRKDGVGQLERRRQQLVIDLEYTRRGWKIVNLTPRDYFHPL